MQRRFCGLATQLERGEAGAGERGYVLNKRGRHCFEFSTFSKEWTERGGVEPFYVHSLLRLLNSKRCLP